MAEYVRSATSSAVFVASTCTCVPTPRFMSSTARSKSALALSRCDCCDWMREFKRLALQDELLIGDDRDLRAGLDAVALLDG